LQALSLGGAQLLWLVPWRLLFFLLYALGWRILLRPYDPERSAELSWLFWVTTVREAVDRLLPVASVGGGVVGVRLLRWRGIDTAPAAATVIVEIILTLLALWVFMVLAVVLLVRHTLATGAQLSTAARYDLSLAAAAGLAVPLVLGVWLSRGNLFARLASALRRLTGLDSLSAGAVALDVQLRDCLGRRRALVSSGTLHLLALLSGSLEVWFVLHLLAQPVDLTAAATMEGLSLAARQAAFIIPGGLGVQEASLMLLGHTFGISTEMALAVSLAKRLREVLCGVPALLSWQWSEMRRLRASA
jgi:putative membrane protein